VAKIFLKTIFKNVLSRENINLRPSLWDGSWAFGQQKQKRHKWVLQNFARAKFCRTKICAA
jgi:hypothetical protein